MSRVTRSSVNLSGDITEYLIENSSMGPGGGANPEDIQSLLQDFKKYTVPTNLWDQLFPQIPTNFSEQYTWSSNSK